jgi:hypothetical protein
VTFVGSVADIPKVVAATLPHGPESFELYDDHTFKIAMKFLPDIAKRMGGSMISLGIQFLPEMWMAATGGVPKVVLIAEFTGATQEEADTRANAAYKELSQIAKNVIFMYAISKALKKLKNTGLSDVRVLTYCVAN